MLTNAEILAVNQNSENNRQLFRQENRIVWTADIPGSKDKYLALFNLGNERTAVEVKLIDLGINSDCRIMDLWSGKELGSFSGNFQQVIVPHGSGLYRLAIYGN
jgi:hypothetical protein